MPKKIIILIMIVTLITGCSYGYNPSIEESYPETQIAIAITDRSEDIVIDAIDKMSQIIKEKTAGAVSLTYYKSEDPIMELHSGRAEIAYGLTEMLSQYGADYGLVESPYIFKTVEESLTALDSDGFERIYSDYMIENLSAKVLGITYNGGSALVANHDSIDRGEDYIDTTVIIGDNEFLHSVFQGFNSQVIISDITEIPEEIYGESPTAIVMDYSLTTELDISKTENQIKIVNQPIINNYGWLIVDDSWWQQQPEDVKALIGYGEDFFAYEINSYHSTEMDKIRNELSGKDIQIVYDDLEGLQEDIYNSILQSMDSSLGDSYGVLLEDESLSGKYTTERYEALEKII